MYGSFNCYVNILKNRYLNASMEEGTQRDEFQEKYVKKTQFNLFNPELNPICYLLALLGAHHFLHVSRIRVKLLTFRLLMSYIYIYIYIWSTHS